MKGRTPDMLYVIVLFLVGLVLICAGGDRLVNAASAISAQFGIPQIVVGATVVSFCTTLPEVLVSATAIHLGSTAICVGNALGSVICNTSLIAGLSLLIRPSDRIARRALLWRTLFFFAVIAAMQICGMAVGAYAPPVGIALLLLFAVYMLLSVRFSRGEAEEGSPAGLGSARVRPAAEASMVRTSTTDPFAAEGARRHRLSFHILMLAVSAVLLFVGADMLVDNGIILAEYLGIPERVIAVTAIALGTSLPELVTTILSLVRRHSDIGLGNVIGANLLNLLLVIGIPAAFTRIPLDAVSLRLDMPLAILVMLILTVPTLVRGKSSRVQGGILLLIYLVYCMTAQ